MPESLFDDSGLGWGWPDSPGRAQESLLFFPDRAPGCCLSWEPATGGLRRSWLGRELEVVGRMLEAGLSESSDGPRDRSPGAMLANEVLAYKGKTGSVRVSCVGVSNERNVLAQDVFRGVVSWCKSSKEARGV